MKQNEDLGDCSSVNEVICMLNVAVKPSPELLYLAMKELLESPDTDDRNVKLGCLLTGLMVHKPSVDQLVALFEGAFSQDNISPYNYEKERILFPEKTNLVSIVGSGKKGVKTVNISTASAIVAASAGAFVLKPGSSSVSSVTGSTDVLSAVGVNTEIALNDMKRVVQATGFGVFKIENFLTVFGSLYNNKLYTAHVLSYALAALANPIYADSVLYGFTHPDIKTSLAVLNKFGFNDALVTSCTHDGLHYIDEIGIYGETNIVGSVDGIVGRIKKFQPTDELNLPKYTYSDISSGRTLEDNVRMFVDVLNKRGSTALTDIVAINASGVLLLAKKIKTLEEGYELAKAAIFDGCAFSKLNEVIEATNGDFKYLERYL